VVIDAIGSELALAYFICTTLFGGIDKLTYRHGLALQDRGLNAQYIDASAHCEVTFKSKHARKSHIPVTELVNLSIPDAQLNHAKVPQSDG